MGSRVRDRRGKKQHGNCFNILFAFISVSPFHSKQKTNRMYALIDKISKNKGAIDQILEQSQIFKNEPRLDKHMCYILVTELLFGAKKLNGDSKPVQCIRSYEDKFKQILADIEGDASKASASEAGATTSTTSSSKGSDRQ